MTPEEKASAEKSALIAEIKEASEKGAEAKINAFKASPEFQELVSKAAEAKTAEAVADVKAKFDALSASIEGKLEKAKSEPVVGKSLRDALIDAFTAKKSEIDMAVKGNQTAAIKLEVKAVGTMSVESTIGSGSTQVSITQDTGIISQIRKRELTYLAQVSVGTIGTNRAMWIEETDEEGTPIMLGEGDAKTQLDVQYVEQTMSVKKIAVYGKVTTELMADIPQLVSYIQNNLMRRQDIVLENQYFNGNGIGDNLKGLITYATAFNAGALANTISDANELDVMEAVALQVKTAFGQPNAIFVHPSTMSKIKLIKDSTGRPVWKDYVTIDGTMKVSGMNVIETTAITAGDFVGGDLKVANVLIREEMGIQIGLDGNDFTQNKKTMLLEKRAVQFVSANDTPCIVTGTFTDAIVDLDPLT